MTPDKASVNGGLRRVCFPMQRVAIRRLLGQMLCVRFGEFALSLHPDKTRLIEFGRFAANDRKRGLPNR